MTRPVRRSRLPRRAVRRHRPGGPLGLCLALLPRLALLPLLVLAALAGPSRAHEVRPAWLDLVETAPGEFDALFKTPMRGELRLALRPLVSGATEELAPVATRRVGDGAVQTWRFRAEGPLRGRTLTIAGLEATMTDTLARIAFADGSSWSHRFTGAAPTAVIPLLPSPFELARTYAALGVEHILLGIDHLLFVLGLLLVTGGGWRLVRTVTAFTVAHSLTLALAALGVVEVPPRLVEALVALSILFLGPEIVRSWRGGTSLTIRQPWLVAFGFGLLHGLGFAGGLSLAGMPEAAIPQALLWFNLGVEAGQLAFVLGVLLLLRAFAVLRVAWPLWLARAPGYAVGIAGAFWTFERLGALLAGRLA